MATNQQECVHRTITTDLLQHQQQQQQDQLHVRPRWPKPNYTWHQQEMWVTADARPSRCVYIVFRKSKHKQSRCLSGIHHPGRDLSPWPDSRLALTSHNTRVYESPHRLPHLSNIIYKHQETASGHQYLLIPDLYITRIVQQSPVSCPVPYEAWFLQQVIL